MSDELELLLAEREITRRLTEYCRAMDRCDYELGKSVFHPGTYVDYGESYRGSADGFVDWGLGAHRYLDHHLHRISNITIEVAGDEAGSETYVEAVFRMTRDGKPMEMRSAGRYVDRWRRIDGRWAISARTYLHTTDSLRALDDAPKPITGTRYDHDDPSYAALADYRE